MKLNERELALMSEEKSDMEGRMNHKKVNVGQYYQSVFKERWFKLIDNILFYFRINDSGKIAEKQVVGVFILENVVIQIENEQDCPFAFSITFKDDPDRKHLFSCMSEANVSLWISKLHCASYEYLRSQLYLLQSHIYSRTGKDPLLMVPRNAGSMNWAPGQPLPITVPFEKSIEKSKSIVTNSGFKSHISNANTGAVIHRSKSTANVVNKVVVSNSPLEYSWPGHSGVERSKTSAHVYKPEQFGKVMYSRPAPSPPPRKKNSLQPQQNGPVLTTQMKDDFVFCDFRDIDVQKLTQPPLPPQRRNSPKLGLRKNELEKTVDNSSEGDLIQF